MLTRLLILFIVSFCHVNAMQEFGSLISSGLMRRMATFSTHHPMGDGIRESSTGIIPNKQVFTIPTYDAAFKWVLDEDDVRLSFLHAFAPGVNIKSSKRIDENMNPVKGMQLFRHFVHHTKTLKTVNEIKSDLSTYKVVKGKNHLVHYGATELLSKMVTHFYDIKKFFPKAPYDGKMDLVCKLDTGDYALVEMQVIPNNYLDRRALAYVASFYGNQLSRGRNWKEDIKRVIGIKILGGGKEDTAHWKDAPSEYVRHYKFEDQMNGKKGRFLDAIELIQYSIENAPKVRNREKQDWLTFFKEAHHMTEKDVEKNIKTPEVLKAFERATISKLPAEVRKSYEAEDKEYDRYSQHTSEKVAEGVAKSKIQTKNEIEKVLKGAGMKDRFISKILSQVKSLDTKKK